MGFLKWLFTGCPHEWEVVVHDVFPSAVEQWHATGESGGNGPAWAFRKKSLVILKCTKCGKINKTETTFDPSK